MKKKKHILISEWLIVVSFICLVITTFLQVLFRYVINLSLSWTDELSRYCFVWLVFSGIVISFIRGEHAIVNLVVDRFKGGFKKVVVIVIDVLVFILFAVLSISGVMLMNLSVGQSTASLGIPKMLVYAALPFGGAMMLIELTLKFYRRFTGRLGD